MSIELSKDERDLIQFIREKGFIDIKLSEGEKNLIYFIRDKRISSEMALKFIKEEFVENILFNDAFVHWNDFPYPKIEPCIYMIKNIIKKIFLNIKFFSIKIFFYHPHFPQKELEFQSQK